MNNEILPMVEHARYRAAAATEVSVRRKAERVGAAARWLFAGAGLAAGWAMVERIDTGNWTGPAELAGGLVGIGLWLVLIAQVMYVRAALESGN